MKVSLLGDSIRMIGYGTKVPELLGNGFEVFQPTENCRFSKYTLRGLFDWKDGMKGSRIVHWNNGLWDICDLFGDGTFTSLEEYVSNMTRIADILLKNHEVIIFATTTPVTSEHAHNKNANIIRFNEAIVPILEKKGIIINDLFTPVYNNIDEYIRKDDNIHLSDKGIEVCSRLVADKILEAAKTLE